jgi:hypothetical protein
LKCLSIWRRLRNGSTILFATAKKYTLGQLDHFENLASRFSRASDLLISKVYRSIDGLEFVGQR